MNVTVPYLVHPLSIQDCDRVRCIDLSNRDVSLPAKAAASEPLEVPGVRKQRISHKYLQRSSQSRPALLSRLCTS